MFEKDLYTPKHDIFAIDTDKTNKLVGPCFSYESLNHLYGDFPNHRNDNVDRPDISKMASSTDS